MSKPEKKTEEEGHRARHIELHQALDELVADWAIDQPRGKVFSNSTIMELIEWSYHQTLHPRDKARPGSRGDKAPPREEREC